MNGVLINEVQRFLAPIPSETKHAIQLENPNDAIHPIIFPLKLNGVTRYFDVRKTTREEYEDQNVIKIKLTVEAPPWDPFSHEYSQQEQSMFDNHEGLSALTLQQGDNYLSTLSHHMFMMLYTLWKMTTLPQCWTVL